MTRSNTRPVAACGSAPRAPEAEIGRELSALRHAYAKEFPDLVARAREAVAAAREDGGSVAAVDRAHRLVHTLVGNSGVFGFRTVSRALREIELAIEAVAGDGSDAAWIPLDAALGQVATSFEAEWSVLRASEALELASGTATQQRPDPESQKGHRFTARVLVVDDDPEVLRGLEIVSRRHMIHVLAARSGAEALELAAEEQTLDAAILDVHLAQGESGYDVARRLREQPGLAELPIGFFSHDSSMASRVKAAHAGGSIFLEKADSADQFAEAVQHLLALRQAIPHKVLLLGEDPAACAALREELTGRGLDVTVTSDATSILEALTSVAPSALLIQANLEPVTGFDLCKTVRTASSWRDLPIVLLTESDGREVRRACFDAGADDYVSAPICSEELVARMTVLMERVRLQRERADRDGLTGVLTRRAFLETCNARLAEARRKQARLSLCLVDLDHFKGLNDRFGHEAGDRVLVAFGSLVRARFRAFDVRGRWGGEEFAIAVYGEPAAVAERVLQRVLDEFRALDFEHQDGATFSASFSAGIACHPEDGSDVHTLFRVADARLYRAKHAGRSRIEWEAP